MLFFIQFWRVPPRAGCRCVTAGLEVVRGGIAGQKVFFGLEVESAGMLAREVQATAIADRVSRGRRGVNGGLVGLTGRELVP